jgi:hypothetical protein
MIKCKKHKPSSSVQGHHRNPQGNCENCVYFSKQNCGSHFDDVQGGFTA